MHITLNRVNQLTATSNEFMFEFYDVPPNVPCIVNDPLPNTMPTNRREREPETPNWGNVHKIRLVDMTPRLSEVAIAPTTTSSAAVNTTSYDIDNNETNQFTGLDFVEFVRTRKSTAASSQRTSLDTNNQNTSPVDTRINIRDISSVDHFTNVKFDHEIWLEEQELGDLTARELDELTQEYLTSVITQLVQLATQDDELSQELDSIDSHGFNFMHYSCMCNLAKLVPLLLSRGANPNIPSKKEGKTPLHIAATLGHIELVRILLNSSDSTNSIQIGIKDVEGKTPRDLAIANNHADIASLLSEVRQCCLLLLSCHQVFFNSLDTSMTLFGRCIYNLCVL